MAKRTTRNIISCSHTAYNTAFTRDLLEIALPFPMKLPMHDMWIGMIGEVFGKTYFCEEKLVKYRRHNNNVSQTLEGSTYSLMKKFQIRTALAYNVLKRYIEVKIA